MELDDSDGEVEQIQLQHSDLYLVEFIKDYLVNRKVAKNVYIYADVFLTEGEILTRVRIQELYDKAIESVSIYVSNTTTLGICSKIGFGGEVKGNPFKISVLAINDVIGKMPYHEAQSFLSILLGEEMIKTNKRIQGLIDNATKEGRLGRNIERLSNNEDGELNFTKLNCTELAEVKTYLLYCLLQENNLKISLRLLELVVKVILE